MPKTAITFTKLESIIASLGFELVELELTENGLVRIFIDKAGRKPSQRDGGITVENCAFVSHHLTHWFAVEEVDFGRLEISSPGVDRPVRKLEDFLRFKGERIKIRLHELVDGRRNIEGVISGVDGKDVLVDVAGVEWRLGQHLIDRAKLDPELNFRPVLNPADADAENEAGKKSAAKKSAAKKARAKKSNSKAREG